uniref:Uncharacterized protein n=1 Tax=uncultured haloarchaeon TaxID=160804 RepID=A5YT10_9EURY|nr:hypothetical protein [uncultured haloarchaeon]
MTQVRHMNEGTSGDTGSNTTEANQCVICESTQNLALYPLDVSLDQVMDPPEKATLCTQHYRIATLCTDKNPDLLHSDNKFDDPETQKITVRVPRALVDATDNTAESQEVTRSEFVRHALELAMTVDTTDNGFDDILALAISQKRSRPQTQAESGADTEFLKERIRRLESLLEESMRR